MQDVYLIGMAPPEPSGKQPWPIGDELKPLDPRHGVFPNLVATPLLSILMFLKPYDQLEFLKQIPAILEPKSDRRLNVFSLPITNKTPDSLQIPYSKNFIDLLHSFNPKKDLLLIFGFWSSFALIHSIVNNCEINKISRKEIKSFSREFCSIKTSKIPKSTIARTGIAFKILSGLSRDDKELSIKIKQKYSDELLPRLSAIVPLLHNEAYQNQPFGKSQCIFMNAMDSIQIEKCKEYPKYYWEFIGDELSDRITK